MEDATDDEPLPGTCGTCPHWLRQRAPGGVCKRHPPTVLPGAGPQGVQPITHTYDHCGEHPARQIPPLQIMASGPPLSEQAARIQPPRGRKRK